MATRRTIHLQAHQDRLGSHTRGLGASQTVLRRHRSACSLSRSRSLFGSASGFGNSVHPLASHRFVRLMFSPRYPPGPSSSAASSASVRGTLAFPLGLTQPPRARLRQIHQSSLRWPGGALLALLMQLEFADNKRWKLSI